MYSSTRGNKRHLVNRQRNQDESSPAPRSRQREPDSAAPTALPPYEPPTCTLSASAKHALEDLRNNHDYGKYNKHLKSSITLVNAVAVEANDRLWHRKNNVEKAAEKRLKRGIADDEMTEEETEDRRYLQTLEKKVSSITVQAEKALRDLIDYGDELAMQDAIMKEVGENIPSNQPAAGPRPRRLRVDDHGGENGENQEPGEDENDLPVTDESILSAVEILKKAKQDYVTEYAAKSMKARYADHNEYKGFKGAVHDALHQDDDAPAPHSSTWFPDEHATARSGERVNNDDDDDEIIISKATINLKCPLTLQYFKEPYSNHVCKHTFEKQAIIEYHSKNAVAFAPPSQPVRGHRPSGPRKVKCPEIGCEAMLQLQDFYDDHLILRQVKRAQKKAAHDYDDDDEDMEDAGPRGTQRNRPEQIEDDDSGEEEQTRKKIARVKRERHQSRGLSMAANPNENEIEVMDIDMQ